MPQNCPECRSGGFIDQIAVLCSLDTNATVAGAPPESAWKKPWAYRCRQADDEECLARIALHQGIPTDERL